MQKGYKRTIIGGFFGGLGGIIGVYIILGEIRWEYLIFYPIFFAFVHFIGHLLRDRRGEKKDMRKD